MISKNNNKQDNEVYILGSDSPQEPGKDKKYTLKWFWLLLLVVIVVIGTAIYIHFSTSSQEEQQEELEYYFEPEETIAESATVITTDSSSLVSKDYADEESVKINGYIETIADSINDIPLFIHIPHNTVMKLQVGMPDKSDTTIVFAGMAADIRKDNQEIVGDFVLSGKQLARGTAKKGFCAIEGDKITLGIGESTPLLQQVINNGGSFFRQYPLVNNGELIENKPKGKAVRRALAIRNERIVMIETKNKESFNDFSQALIDIGVTDAIYLVGGTAYGWYRDKEQIRHEFGEELPEIPDNISYIIWQIE